MAYLQVSEFSPCPSAAAEREENTSVLGALKHVGPRFFLIHRQLVRDWISLKCFLLARN